MASAEAALFTILTTDPTVNTLVGTRCYPLVIPQNPVYPCLRVQRISTPRSQYRDLEGRAEYASPRFQIDCFALNHSSMLAVADAVYRLLEGYSGTAAGLRIDAISSDDQGSELEAGAGPNGSNLYRSRQDVFVFHPE